MSAPSNKQVLEPSSSKMEEKHVSTRSDTFKNAVFLGTVTSVSLMFGFGTTVAMAKKSDPSMFAKGLFRSREAPVSGGILALRALGRGTLYAISGVSLFCFVVWKSLGVKSMEEFRMKCKSSLITVPKKPLAEQGRNDFNSLQDLVSYILEEDNAHKSSKS